MRDSLSTRPRRTAALTLGLLLAAGTQAMGVGQTGLVNQGEQTHVVYPPGHAGNIVGGGPVRVPQQGARESHVEHYDDDYAFAAPGTPVDTGGRNGEVVYLEPSQPADPMLLTSRDGNDGTLMR